MTIMIMILFIALQTFISAKFAINLSKFVYKKLYTQKLEKDGDFNITIR